ncbi:MAG: CsbD family protein [Betaproteobacteria bacterium]
MNKDQIKGRVEEVKGKVKEVTGAITGDTGLEVEGKVQKNLGKGQAAYGDVKRDVKNDAEKAK